MTKGVLLFAQNGEFKYTDLAEIAARKVADFLNLPVSVVVNEHYENDKGLFDQIINVSDEKIQYRMLKDGEDNFTKVKWLNFTRADAYDLSPYDETLVIDVDYILNSNWLNCCFESDKDFLIFNEHFDLSSKRNLTEFDYINPFSIKFYWATVFYFKKTQTTQMFFTLIKYIRDNWFYYCYLYQIKEMKYRNDFAFSIAIHLFFQHRVSKHFGFIPGKKFFTIDTDFLIKDNEQRFTFLVSNNNDSTLQPVSVKNTDVHVMNKFSVLRCYSE